MSTRTAICLFLYFSIYVLAGCGGGGSDGGTNVAPPTNRAPTVSAQSVDADEGMEVSIQLAGSDPDGDAITYVVTTGPMYGTLQLDGTTGQANYTPNIGAPGSDSFVYVADDGQVRSSTAIVSIDINRTPNASALDIVASQVDTYVGTLSGSDADNDALTFSIEATTNDGLLTLVDATTGQFVYRPNDPSTGTDSFTYRVSDGRLESPAAAVSLGLLPSVDRTETQKVIAMDGEHLDRFGEAVALHSNVMFVSSGVKGSYVFGDSPNSVWLETQKLSNAYFLDADLDDSNFVTAHSSGVAFGSKQADDSWIVDSVLPGGMSRVAMDAGVAAATSASTARVFVHEQSGTWVAKQDLVANNHTIGDVAISGDIIAVGHSSRTVDVSTEGAVDIWSRNNDGDWVFEATLVADSPGDPVGSGFGNSLALDGNRLLVGAPREWLRYVNDPELVDDDIGAGAAYLFERQGFGQWTQVRRFVASDRARQKQFGNSVAMNGNTLAISDWSSNNLVGVSWRPGTTYVFVREPTGDWLERAKLRAVDDWTNSYFGRRIDFSGDTVVVGAHQAVVPATVAPGTSSCSQVGYSAYCTGAVYVFDVSFLRNP